MESVQGSTYANWREGTLNTKQNSWAQDYLPDVVRKVGSVVKKPFATVWNTTGDFFNRHQTIKRITIGLAILGVVTLVAFSDSIIHTKAIQSLIQSVLHSSVVQFGQNIFLWGKTLGESLWKAVPAILGVATVSGALVVLTDPNPTLWSSTNSTLVIVGGMICGFGITGTFAH